MADKQYDIAIIGAGPGGYVAALHAAGRGAKVAIVEQRHLGGVCLNDGCIPSKTLLASAKLLHRAGDAEDWGVKIDGEIGFDWSAIQKKKDKVIATLRGGVGMLFKKRGITLLNGRGKIVGKGKITVDKQDGGKEQIAAKNIILATGSSPVAIPGMEIDEHYICTTDQALHWDTLPSRLLIIGGGVIGCEFACMMRAYGVEVTVVEMMPRLLPLVEAELGREIEKIFASRGIKCLTGAKVQNVDISNKTVTATVDDGQSIEADRILMAVGRRANVDDIGLEKLSIHTEKGYIPTDDTLATGAENCYCIGDANGRWMLAHAASDQGKVAVDNALGRRRVCDSPVPNCIYTFPELASVGITTEQARRKNIPVSVGHFPLAFHGKALSAGHTEGFVKVITARDDGRILGVHAVGYNATEFIAAAGVAVHQKATAEELAEVVFAHPTMAETLAEAAEDSLTRALHLPPRKITKVTAGG